ncbi:MAG: iron donor protein CyaY [Pseudomonadota bacterium]|jgi:CyaY protein
MTESEFNRLADATLARIEEAIEASGAEIDFETAAGILDLTFANGSKIIINRQPAAQEIWMAAKSGGYHFAWRDGVWRNTRDGGELFADLSRCASEQAGEPVTL